jgi:hypothetical protein
MFKNMLNMGMERIVNASHDARDAAEQKQFDITISESFFYDKRKENRKGLKVIKGTYILFCYFLL